MKSTKISLNDISAYKFNIAREWIEKADNIIVGAGAGLSAEGGLNYNSPELTEKWFPSYYRSGLTSLPIIQSLYWIIEQSDLPLYWGYWAQHIFHIRYETPSLPVYKSLLGMLSDKNYFICSTNVDGQFEKAGFPVDRIYAPQGDYGLFQCSVPCRDEVYPNGEMIQQMIEGLSLNSQGLPVIQKQDIPRCPHCGELLKPNIRCDHSFVETPHLRYLMNYQSFIQDCLHEKGKTILLELGCGFNTPSIIRYPFETLTRYSPYFSMIRINPDHSEIPQGIEDRAMGINSDLSLLFETENR